MIRRTGRWRDVEPGNYVKDATGKVWKVVRWNHITATLQDREGAQGTARPNPYDSVEILTPTMDEAIDIVKRVLPGTEVIEDTKEAS